jgi:GTPase
MFVDQATIVVKAGDGGAGSSSIRREPYRPKGGPDGGDGGKGGDVVLKVDSSLFDLSGYADHPHHRAKSGRPGSSNNRHGANGEDLTLPVPDGTVVRDERGLLADLVGEGTTVVAARGGRGGRGNASLASARNRVPRIAERGEPGEGARLELELRLVADVALVGPPNAGKSTLLSKLTAAKPKIAEYPFTTLEPNLGVAGDENRFVVADVPGLIEGAHEGKGLGLTFLRHVSRSRVLVYVVDLSGDPQTDLAMLRQEVARYDPGLSERHSMAVGSKVDLVPGGRRSLPPGIELAVSGLTGEGVDELEARLAEEVAAARAEEPERSSYVVMRPGREPFVVKREGEHYVVAGQRVERWVEEADLEDPGQVVALQRRLVRAGVERRLAEAGARRGDEVMIAGRAFEFIPEDSPESTEPDRGDRPEGRGHPAPPSSMAIKRKWLAAEDRGWTEYHELIDSLTPQQMEQPGYFPEGWSVKDLMAHIASWQAETVQVLEQIRMGTFERQPVDVDAMNERFYEANKDLPLSVVRAESWAARIRMLEEWDALPEVTPEAEEWFVESGPNHYAEHIDRLREWVKELTAR